MRPGGFIGFFLCLKIIIMAKIILIDGVINVEESYQQIKGLIYNNHNWLQLTLENLELKTMERETGIKQDYHVLINVQNIQCVKP